MVLICPWNVIPFFDGLSFIVCYESEERSLTSVVNIAFASVIRRHFKGTMQPPGRQQWRRRWRRSRRGGSHRLCQSLRRRKEEIWASLQGGKSLVQTTSGFQGKMIATPLAATAPNAAGRSLARFLQPRPSQTRNSIKEKGNFCCPQGKK